jgi:aminoglycoside phosphotransferase (APT) family kinase protein
VSAGEQPDPEVLEHYGIAAVLAELGGGSNQHWLVEAGGERLVLRRYGNQIGDVGYELRVLDRLRALGWPVPYAVTGLYERTGTTWGLFVWLPGNPRPRHDGARERGRLLGRFAFDLETLTDLGQRDGVRTADEVVADALVDTRLRELEPRFPEETRIMRWHLDRARELFAGLDLATARRSVVHGDFVNWNLLYERDRLTGIVDFEATHLNYRVSEFALSWRGAYDEVILGYDEVNPLSDLDHALLTPTWWAWLLWGLVPDYDEPDLEWTVRKLLTRTPLMNAPPYPG